MRRTEQSRRPTWKANVAGLRAAAAVPGDSTRLSVGDASAAAATAVSSSRARLVDICIPLVFSKPQNHVCQLPQACNWYALAQK
jgi:hypothetical protein